MGGPCCAPQPSSGPPLLEAFLNVLPQLHHVSTGNLFSSSSPKALTICLLVWLPACVAGTCSHSSPWELGSGFCLAGNSVTGVGWWLVSVLDLQQGTQWPSSQLPGSRAQGGMNLRWIAVLCELWRGCPVSGVALIVTIGWLLWVLHAGSMLCVSLHPILMMTLRHRNCSPHSSGFKSECSWAWWHLVVI